MGWSRRHRLRFIDFNVICTKHKVRKEIKGKALKKTKMKRMYRKVDISEPILSSSSSWSSVAGNVSKSGDFKNRPSKWVKSNLGGILKSSVWIFFPPLIPLMIPLRILGWVPCSNIEKLFEKDQWHPEKNLQKRSISSMNLLFLLIWRETKGSICSSCKNFIMETR